MIRIGRIRGHPYAGTAIHAVIAAAHCARVIRRRTGGGAGTPRAAIAYACLRSRRRHAAGVRRLRGAGLLRTGRANRIAADARGACRGASVLIPAAAEDRRTRKADACQMFLRGTTAAACVIAVRAGVRTRRSLHTTAIGRTGIILLRGAASTHIITTGVGIYARRARHAHTVV